MSGCCWGWNFSVSLMSQQCSKCTFALRSISGMDTTIISFPGLAWLSENGLGHICKFRICVESALFVGSRRITFVHYHFLNSWPCTWNLYPGFKTGNWARRLPVGLKFQNLVCLDYYSHFPGLASKSPLSKVFSHTPYHHYQQYSWLPNSL